MQRMNKLKQAARDTIPNVGPNFWAFRGMLAAGGLIILLDLWCICSKFT